MLEFGEGQLNYNALLSHQVCELVETQDKAFQKKIYFRKFKNCLYIYEYIYIYQLFTSKNIFIHKQQRIITWIDKV